MRKLRFRLYPYLSKGQLMENILMKRIIAALLFIISVNINAQMVPHPSLLEKIRSGEIAKPFALENIKELKQKGVSTSWVSDELKERNSKLSQEEITRIVGPAEIVSGSFNAIFLFVSFPDQPAEVPIEFFDDLLFTKEAGSMWHYFNEVSYGNLDLTTLDLPSSIGWVTMPYNYSYYVAGDNGFGNFPTNAQGLTRDAVKAVDDQIDFSQYDNNNDGEIDALFIVHTGPGAEFTGNNNDIWSHAWSIPGGGYTTNDGVKAYTYSMEPEYWSTPGDMTIGVYVHEMGHSVFGLPDVYDVDYSSEGVGDWSLMAGGSWNGNLGNKPAWPDAWNHIQMGYVNPTVVTSDLISENITSMAKEPDVYKIWKDGAPGKEYFLVQNRQKVGYDGGLPGTGLLIWHIDETKFSNSNEWYPGYTNNGNFLVALEQSDGRYDLERGVNSGDIRDPFPGFTNNTQFNFLSSPGSNSYGNMITYAAVENISPSDSIMTADIKISEPAVYLQVISPNGGETWQGDSEKIIEWASNGVDNVSIELSIDGGANWQLLQTNYDAETNVYTFVVPNTPSENCLVRLLDESNNELVDQSNSPFKITAAPDINLLSPNGGEVFNVGDQIQILWNSESVSSVRIQYSIDNGSNWLSVTPITSSDGIHNWTVPNKPSDQCLIKITEIPSGIVIDQSDAVFTINSVVSVEKENLPDKYDLMQNYPNPFNPSTSIEYTVPSNEYVSLKVYDILGNEIVTLVNQQKEAGKYKVEFDASSISSGIYYYKIQAGNFIQVRKMILLK